MRTRAEGTRGDRWFTGKQTGPEFPVRFHRADEGGAGPRPDVAEARPGGPVSHDFTRTVSRSPSGPFPAPTAVTRR
ncbi:hypothetical protein SUDANB126_01604 [Streptomyces sp. enrichment culture]